MTSLPYSLPSITATDIANLLNAALSPSTPYWANFQSSEEYPMVLGATDNRPAQAQNYRADMMKAIQYLQDNGCVIDYPDAADLCAHAQIRVATTTRLRYELQQHGIHPMPPNVH